MTDPKDVVRRGCDAIAERYNAWADSFETPEREWVDIEDDWLGAPMFFASFDETENLGCSLGPGSTSRKRAWSRSESPATGSCASCGCSRRGASDLSL